MLIVPTPYTLINYMSNQLRLLTTAILELQCHVFRSPQSLKPYLGTWLVFKPVCRDSSEIDHCLLHISLGEIWDYDHPLRLLKIINIVKGQKPLMQIPINTMTTLPRQNIENSKQIFPGKELRGPRPNFHIHVSVTVSDLFISTIGLPILLQENMWTEPGYI